ncbi:MAG: PilT protein domain protein [Candidatus Daviesbacteria bacterium GW2011_GWA1_41_61]|uniref:PilT protein domain protein n=1 Tax=Candidatus Daviesbacteria bacterium GW2011_GWA2_40_9 TaxID=1618424 RepID=A0A0G0X7T4_9BACT|nr:MAG: PilT protein domain protein [Candidatus Daviesbacteria bacterium GW2011_GWC1_40_9]KKR83697.1 MAG: PilT protein domain protein [Candidatus Daviesbacteria bacterium GW2011_GWA2_40_9]KKR93707.1 MAG: PilT protein domain protein [Candidatus Daviesbacteria bacterium GW2011_GWB1_41_15]KKS15173.1 MAG: PilT protein domain protein [Candidatus Daviesbacteria bacterium GW2011_GWA1_41_61]
MGEEGLKTLDKKLNKLKLVGLDTNIFIYYFEQNSEFGQSAKKIFDLLSTNSLNTVTSVISLMEILSPDFLSKVAARETEKKFFDIPNLKVLNVDRTITVEAARIRREYGFRLPDSIQLATALFGKANALITNDERLKKFKELKVINLKDI